MKKITNTTSKNKKMTAPTSKETENNVRGKAQCCAKVSKVVAGCHD